MSPRLDLMNLYRKLYRHFGSQHWWPLFGSPLTAYGSPSKIGKRLAVSGKQFEICVGAILTQNTAWTNVERAIQNLHEIRLMSPEAIFAAPLAKLRRAIRPAGYFNQKAKKLKEFSRFVLRAGGLPKLFRLPVPMLRAKLLGVWGIGRETADSIILYAATKPIFVVDTYTKRLLNCFGIRFRDYDAYRLFFESRLPRSAKLWNEYHALIVIWGKLYARAPQEAGKILGI